ncbi:MAG: 2-hydroxyacid dehydrogenase [Lachnospiraceae bacterium]|nr:2-hydroxyacid dehydrogenase [Lachnospiraceae bacterium]
MAMKIVIGGPYPKGVFEKFESMLAPTGAQVISVSTQEEYEALTEADIIVLRVLKMSEADMERVKGLKAIIRWGAGFDTVDIEAAGKRGIYVCNTPGANAFAVAELTIMMMLALGRKLTGHEKKIAQGDWSKLDFLDKSSTLYHKTLGIVGGGNVGRQVAKRAAVFGMTVKYYDPYRLKPEMEEEFGMEYTSLEYLLKTADFVSIHVPLMDSTYHLIGKEQLSLMKKSAYLINVARGGIVDDKALEEAVASGNLAGAGIDTPEVEPPAADSGLRDNPDIILTPHVGGDVPDVSEVAIPMICENIQKFLETGVPDHIVNGKYLQSA